LRWLFPQPDKRMIPMPPIGTKPNIKELFEELLKTGKLTPIINSCYQLSEVPEGIRYY